MWLFNLKNTLPLMRKKPYGKILKNETKKQHLSTVPNSWLRLGGGNEMKWNEMNHFRIFFPSLVWEF